MRWILFGSWVGCVAIGCGGGTAGGDDSPPDLLDIADQPAQGTIAGTAWTLGSRAMDVSGGSLNVDLMLDNVADCTKDETTASYPFAIFFTPTTPGRYVLGTDQFVTFVDQPSDNLIVSRGVIEIDAITATTVSAGLHVFDPEFGELNGRFDGALCFSN